MKLQQKFRLADQFDRPETTIIIASYPARKDRSIAKIDAVASYTDHFARSFNKEMGKHNRRVVIFAQKIDREEWYTEKGMLICRVWDKGSPLCFAQIIGRLILFHQATSLLVQFEFHQFGGKLETGLFPVFLGALRLLGKSVTLVLHQVVSDVNTLSGHLNLTKNTFLTKALNTSLKMFYRLCTLMTHNIIVHNRIFAQRLAAITGTSQAAIIPHGLGAIRPKYSKENARKILGYKKRDYIILSFGFLTWYKGSDWITETVARSGRKNVRLILAGGTSPNIQSAGYYRRFVHTIEDTARSHANIRLTGFVEDKDIPLYFAAADLVVLPYRSLMSASGPLAMTLSFKKPFIVSHALRPYMQDKDFTGALHASGLTADEMSFPLSQNAFWKRVSAIQRHPKRYKKLSRLLRSQRLWPHIAARFYESMENVGLEHYGKFAILKGGMPATYAKT